jgi:hypothetical protein
MVGVNAGAEQANVDDIRDYLSCSITSALARTTSQHQGLTLPMMAVGCIAGLAICIVMWIYMEQRVPVFEWPCAAKQSLMPFKAMAGVEFVSIVAATLCFSPQTNTRHLMLALLLTIPLSALILRPREKSDIHLFRFPGQKRWMGPFFAPFGARIGAIVGALLIGFGFIFPPGGQAPESHHLAMMWFGKGGQCWCLLLAMFLLVWSAVRDMRASH